MRRLIPGLEIFKVMPIIDAACLIYLAKFVSNSALFMHTHKSLSNQGQLTHIFQLYRSSLYKSSQCT